MRRCVIAHADAVRDRPGFRAYAAMVTLTYRPGEAHSSRQVTRYIQRTMDWCGRRGVKPRYQWVIELTAAGVPHYHVLWWLPEGFRLPKPDAQGHWPHGSSRIERARRAVGYLVKYATKGHEGGDIPRGARLFGTGGCALARHHRHRAGLPRWLDEVTDSSHRCQRVPFAGWLDRDTGELHQSPYRVVFGVGPDGVPFIQSERRPLDG